MALCSPSMNTIMQTQIEIEKKTFRNFFKNLGRFVSLEQNSKVVNYLDVTSGLNTGLYSPVHKTIVSKQINKNSSHPGAVIISCIKSLLCRLSRLCANEVIFSQSTNYYNRVITSFVFFQSTVLSGLQRKGNYTHRNIHVTTAIKLERLIV